MSKPIAVLISDIHFSIQDLELSTASLQASLSKAEALDVPLIIAGDLNHTKAIIRAEVANVLCKILINAETPVYILVGNHDLINEKGTEHGLNYLAGYVTIVDKPTDIRVWVDFFKDEKKQKIYLIPYQNNPEAFKELDLAVEYPPGSILIMHQGFLGAAMGDYVQDKTSIDPEIFKDYKVFSGHYHRHQTIGTVTYIGSPYTMSFGEANDGPKGFLVLNDDGSYTQEILNLRRHVIYNIEVEELLAHPTWKLDTNPGDLIWVKIDGPESELNKLSKDAVGNQLFGHSNFKLDLIPRDSEVIQYTPQKQTPTELLHAIIDASGETDLQKAYLKELVNETLTG